MSGLWAPNAHDMKYSGIIPRTEAHTRASWYAERTGRCAVLAVRDGTEMDDGHAKRAHRGDPWTCPHPAKKKRTKSREKSARRDGDPVMGRMNE